MHLWVVGAEQRVGFTLRKEWNLYAKALVVRVEGGKAERVLEYSSPPEHCPDDEPSHCFKAATIRDDTAWLCTQTEILVCDMPSFRIRQVISHPCFNDLHHVTPAPNGHLYAAVTGLDAVAEIDTAGELVRLQSVLEEDVWERFSRDVDYRKVPTTKPHHAHPNYVFLVDGKPWVTRFEQRDAIPLDGDGKAFAVGNQGIHDGHVGGDRVYFTSVDGHVVHFALDGTDRRDLDLNTLVDEPDRPLGWCRGILPTADGTWVGFSRLRFTKLRENVSWVQHGFKKSEWTNGLPTRIARYDLDNPTVPEQVDLEPVGLGAVFSIHA